MNPLEVVPCPRCGALAGIVALMAGGSGVHRAICQRSAGGCGLHLPPCRSAVEAEAEWRRRSVEAALRRERAATRQNRYGWARDPVVVADICEHYVGYEELLPGHVCRVMWAAYDGDERRRMNVQGFVYVYLAPRYAFAPTINDEARVNRILHANGFPIATYPDKHPAADGPYADQYRPKKIIIQGVEPYHVAS